MYRASEPGRNRTNWVKTNKGRNSGCRCDVGADIKQRAWGVPGAEPAVGPVATGVL